jgi:hypothetical protein
MEKFKFWTNWGRELSDRDFANAFLAQGLLTARSRSKPVLGSELNEFPNNGIIKEFIQKELEDAVLDKLDRDGIPALIPWKFPEDGKVLNFAPHRFDSSLLDPQWLASCWETIANNIPSGNMTPRLRLEVTGHPKGELLRPWFRMLFQAAPEDTAAHILIKTSRKDLHVKWPIRIGFIPGNSAEPIIKGASMTWPANENSIPIAINRDNDNCDVLVYDGNITSLKKELNQLPAPMKCNLFLLRGLSAKDSPDFPGQVMELLNNRHSNGIIFVRENLMDKDFHDSIIFFVDNLCHNSPMGSAIASAYARHLSSKADPLVFLSHSLANLRLKHLVDKTISYLKYIPANINIDLPPDTLERMNIIKADIKFPEKTGDLLDVMTKHKNKIVFHAEKMGATGLSNINRVLRHAEVPKMAEKKQANRYIQAKSFIQKNDRLVEEKRAFVKGTPSLFRIRIGPPDKRWESITKAFPVEKLPKQKEPWRLTVILGEPTHIKEPMKQEILLPKFGPSTECDFSFTPSDNKNFEGRVTVLHRGRVIQTAVLKMPVVSDTRHMLHKKNLELAEIIAVRANIGDLEQRRQFDMAFVTNHNSSHRPHLTAIASDHAWLVNLEECTHIAEEINLALSEVAMSVQDYSKGLGSKKGKELLMKLALFGRDLYDSVVEAGLKATLNKEMFARKEYLQIVSTKSDAVIPFEFIYDHEAPDDDAELCGSWREALTHGECPADCSKNGRKTICPLGFWGLSKVIERHDLTPEFSVNNPEYVLQSEAATNRSVLNFSGAGLVAASERVSQNELKSLVTSFSKAVGTPPVKAIDWKHWESLVKKHHPHLLVALPHSDGEGTLATLEINRKTIKSVQIRESHVRTGEQDFPIVALLGCDTTGTAMRYGNFVKKFRLRGAGVVIGTIATVFGGHAAKVAEMLIRGLTEEGREYERIGEIMRAVKRKALLEGLLMSLCIVAFGDADWKLQK